MDYNQSKFKQSFSFSNLKWSENLSVPSLESLTPDHWTCGPEIWRQREREGDYFESVSLTVISTHENFCSCLSKTGWLRLQLRLRAAKKKSRWQKSEGNRVKPVTMEAAAAATDLNRMTIAFNSKKFTCRSAVNFLFLPACSRNNKKLFCHFNYSKIGPDSDLIWSICFRSLNVQNSE